MTATFTLAELQRDGFVLRGDRLVRVERDRVALDKATDAIEADNQEGTWQKAESECRQIFEKAGCEIFSNSQRRKSKVSAGIPDLIVFGPPGAPFHLYWETKAGRGKLSDAQRKFALHCQRTTTRYAAGSPAMARQTLKRLLAEFSQATPSKSEASE